MYTQWVQRLPISDVNSGNAAKTEEDSRDGLPFSWQIKFSHSICSGTELFSIKRITTELDYELNIYVVFLFMYFIILHSIPIIILNKIEINTGSDLFERKTDADLI